MPSICECVLSLKQGTGNHEIGYVHVLRFRPCPNQAIFMRCYANVNSFRSGLGRHFVSVQSYGHLPYTHCTPVFLATHTGMILRACFQYLE